MEPSKVKFPPPLTQVSRYLKVPFVIFTAPYSLSLFSEHMVAPPLVSAPLKFAIPHAVVRFGPAGQLIRISPALSTQETISHLEIHSLEVSRGIWWTNERYKFKFNKSDEWDMDTISQYDFRVSRTK